MPGSPTEPDRLELAGQIVADLSESKRASFLRDTRDDDWEPPMWIRAHDNRLVDYPPANHVIRRPVRLSWTKLGLAVRAALRATEKPS